MKRVIKLPDLPDNDLTVAMKCVNELSEVDGMHARAQAVVAHFIVALRTMDAPAAPLIYQLMLREHEFSSVVGTMIAGAWNYGMKCAKGEVPEEPVEAVDLAKESYVEGSGEN